MDNPKLYRKRLIPDECIFLKDDELLYADETVIVTRWHTLHPKKDLHHGTSCYFLKDGFKVSKFYAQNGDLLYWYCDIVDYTHDIRENSYVFRDLLADVIIYPDGFVKVIDLDELADALEQGILAPPDMSRALRQLNKLLDIIYSGGFERLKKEVESREMV